LFTDNSKGYYTYLVFDENGGLKKGEISFVDFGTESDKYKIEKFEDVKNSIGNQSYPKTFYVKDISLISGEQDESIKGGEGVFSSDLYPEDTIFAQECIANNIELGYYYSNTSDDYITPVYKFECQGETTYQDKTYEITEIIIATAIDVKYLK